MKNSNKNSSGSQSAGIGFCGLLAIVFITLKLLGKITWPWVWVLAPLWVPASIGVIVLICFVLFLIFHGD